MEPYRDPGMQAGTITALTVQRHQPTRVSVFLDGAFAFGIAQELVREWELGVGRCLRVEDQVHLRAADQLLAAQVTALHYLAARPRTVHEVWQKLRRRGVADQVTAHVIARLQARGLLDDTAYAHAYLPARLASRGYGPYHRSGRVPAEALGLPVSARLSRRQRAASPHGDDRGRCNGRGSKPSQLLYVKLRPFPPPLETG